MRGPGRCRGNRDDECQRLRSRPRPLSSRCNPAGYTFGPAEKRRCVMSNYPLRLPDHIMADAKRLAEANGTSLNQFLSSLIAERLGEMKAIAGIEARVARA